MCTCGFPVPAGRPHPAHLGSQLHRRGADIRRMIESGMPPNDVASQLSMTRKWLKEIYQKYMSHTGVWDKYLHRHGPVPEEADPNASVNDNSLIRKLKKVAKEKGITFERILTKKAIYRRGRGTKAQRLKLSQVLLSGRICRIKNTYEATVAGKLYYKISRSGIKQDEACEFHLYHVIGRGWLVIPHSEAPEKGTTFSLDSTINRRYKKRRSWHQYLNAWHLLRSAAYKD